LQHARTAFYQQNAGVVRVDAAKFTDQCLARNFGKRTGHLDAATAAEIARIIHLYGPLPPVPGVTAEALAGHIYKDKKTVQGQTHFVLATALGRTEIVRGIPHEDIVAAAAAALA
jgi:3-dehydroquinate synthetase